MRRTAVFLGVAGIGVFAALSEAQPPATTNFSGVQVVAVAEDQSSLATRSGAGPVMTIAAGKEFQARLRDLRKDDVINIDVEESTSDKTITRGLRGFSAAKVAQVSRDMRLVVLVGALVVLVAVSWSALRRKFWKLVVGKDNRLSNSKFQMALWFSVTIVTYMAAVWLRWWEGGGGYLGGVNLPTNLLLVSGMSALTFGGAKAITVRNQERAKDREATARGKDGAATAAEQQATAQKAAATAAAQKAAATAAEQQAAATAALDAAAGPAGPKAAPAAARLAAATVVAQQAAATAAAQEVAATAAVQQVAATAAAQKAEAAKELQDAQAQQKTSASRPEVMNLVSDDEGRPDLGDFQMLLVTLLAAGVYGAQAFAFLGSIELLKVVSLPDVDTTILATFGLGQGAYLTKKYAGDGA